MSLFQVAKAHQAMTPEQSVTRGEKFPESMVTETEGSWG